MKKGENDLVLAVLDIAKADLGPTGLVGLTGKEEPIVKWRQLTVSGNEPPIIAMQIVFARPGRGAPEQLICTVQFDAVVPDGSNGLEGRLADRLDELFVPQSFLGLGEPLDVAVRLVQRRPLSDLEAGRRRMEVEYEMAFKR